MENNTNGLAKLDNSKILDVIKSMDIQSEEKQALINRVISDDISVRRSALEMITQSQIAQHDLVTILGEIDSLNKKGMYVQAKQTIKTGSGSLEIEMKGGDAKLIIPVLVIVGIIIVASLLIVFWK
jgi:hypothetical protein